MKEPASDAQVWWGKVNKPIDLAHFDVLRRDIITHLKSQELFVQDLYAGADPNIGCRSASSTSSRGRTCSPESLHRPACRRSRGFQPQFTVMTAPSFKAAPARHGTRSDVTIAVNLASREILICGTSYAGEIKKSIFTVLNYLLPLRGVLRCTARRTSARAGDTALFFGLSGTGKTTLSADPQRRLIGDDEHGWSDRGVFNFEGGCYAKMHPPVGRSRAADLERDPLRHGARKRGDGPGDAPARFR